MMKYLIIFISILFLPLISNATLVVEEDIPPTEYSIRVYHEDTRFLNTKVTEPLIPVAKHLDLYDSYTEISIQTFTPKKCQTNISRSLVTFFIMEGLDKGRMQNFNCIENSDVSRTYSVIKVFLKKKDPEFSKIIKPFNKGR